MERQGQISNFQTISSARVPELAKVPQGISLATIKNSRIFTDPSDISQWGRVAEIIDKLNWPADILVRSAIEKGDVVESMEVIAPLEDIEGKVGELIIRPDSVQLWQERGHVLIIRRLPSQSRQSNQIIPSSNQLEGVNQNPPEEAKVIESVGIFPDQTSNSYLQAPADLKKAA